MTFVRQRIPGAAVCAVALLAVLVGCAVPKAPPPDANTLYAQGRYEESLQLLKRLSDENPRNVEYRVNYEARREAAVSQLNARADAALRQGRLTEAEKTFGQILTIDPNNRNAVSGLASVSTERRHRELLQQAEKLLKAGTASDIAQATEIARTVLAENPASKEGRSLNARIGEQRAKASRPAEQQLAASFRKPITLEFRDAPLKSVFDMISRVSGLNFFFDKDVRADLRATILARNTSIEDAVKILLATNQLERKVLNENSILIYPNTPQKLKEYQSLTIRTFYLANADVKAVSNTLKTILKTRDLVIDERLGLIVMRDTPEAIRLAEKLIALQDMGDSEVMLEVEVLEVARSRLLELGIRWPAQATFDILGDPVTVNTLRNLNSEAIGVTIGPTTVNARRDDTDGALLANPRIRVRNREKARFVIGERVPVITTTATSTGFVSDSVSYLDVGLKVEVEPTIYLEDEVGIRVALEVSNLLSEVRSRAGTLAYQIGTRNAATVLRLKDGETQILAGLINQADRVTANKVPGLGSLPILGRLFGSRKDEGTSSEIVLLITPRIMRSIRPPDLSDAEFDSGTEATLGARGLAITPPEATPAAPARSAPAAAPTQSGTTMPSSAPSSSPAAPPASGSTPGTPPPTNAPAAPPAVPPSVSPTPSPVAPTPAPAQAPPTSIQIFSWQAPTQVNVGEQFSAVLRIQSASAVSGLPLVIGFDPATLQLVNVVEGDFLRQGGVQTSFSSSVEPVQGRASIAVVRQGGAGQDSGVNGDGTVIIANLRAVRATDGTKIQLLSVAPTPPPGASFPVPLEFNLVIRQP